MSTFASLLKTALAIIGFGLDCIKNRREYMKRYYDMLSHTFDGQSISIKCIGSKAEGMSLCFEGDIDNMVVLNRAICVERGTETNKAPVVFEMDMSTSAPGYAKLRLSKNTQGIFDIKELLYGDGQNCYLSSKGFVKCLLNYHKFFATRFSMNHKIGPPAGPSIPLTTTFKILNNKFPLKTDNVLCFRCESPTYLEEWCSRQRHGTWPSMETVSNVSTLPANVVPIGEKGHVDQDMQWRICLTEAENYLISTLSENLLQVYFILKKLTQCELTPICDSITSYVVKNIILWMAERLPTDRLGVVPMLLKAILELRMVVDAEHLPSFMIQRRNLLKNKISFREKMMLKKVLTEMLKEKELMILRNKRIRSQMQFAYKYPHLVTKRKERSKKFTRYPELSSWDMIQQYFLFSAINPQMLMLNGFQNTSFI